MADKTRIEWAEATWNPVTGCTKVSPGCDHCYAETFAERWRGTPGHAYEHGFDLTLRPERLDQPLRWQRPRRIFVNSMSDLFHEGVPDGFIAAVWFVMGQCAGLIPEQHRGHTFQLLTKRHARMRAWLRKWSDVGDPAIPPMDPAARRCGRAELIEAAADFLGGPVMYDWMDGPRYWPAALPGVWLGVSVESQQWADIRIPALLDTPAVVRWVSAEPLLGPVNFWHLIDPSDPDAECERCGEAGLFTRLGDLGGHAVHHHCTVDCDEECPLEGEETGQRCPGPVRALPSIDWVVVGGESGHGARPMHPQWARSLRDQCVDAGVPFLFKQAGSVLAREWGCTDRKGGKPDEWREPFPREFPDA